MKIFKYLTIGLLAFSNLFINVQGQEDAPAVAPPPPATSQSIIDETKSIIDETKREMIRLLGSPGVNVDDFITKLNCKTTFSNDNEYNVCRNLKDIYFSANRKRGGGRNRKSKKKKRKSKKRKRSSRNRKSKRRRNRSTKRK